MTSQKVPIMKILHLKSAKFICFLLHEQAFYKNNTPN